MNNPSTDAQKREELLRECHDRVSKLTLDLLEQYRLAGFEEKYATHDVFLSLEWAAGFCAVGLERCTGSECNELVEKALHDSMSHHRKDGQRPPWLN
jgi:hypothetical protein